MESRIEIVEIHTTDRRAVPHVLTLAVYEGHVFFLAVVVERPGLTPFHCFDLELPIKRTA